MVYLFPVIRPSGFLVGPRRRHPCLLADCQEFFDEVISSSQPRSMSVELLFLAIIIFEKVALVTHCAGDGNHASFLMESV